MGIASMVLGIVGLVFSIIPCLWVWAILLTIPGIVLGFIALSAAKKAGTPKGAPLAGIICSIIGTVIALLWLIFAVLLASASSF